MGDQSIIISISLNFKHKLFNHQTHPQSNAKLSYTEKVLSNTPLDVFPSLYSMLSLFLPIKSTIEHIHTHESKSNIKHIIPPHEYHHIKIENKKSPRL